MNKTISYYNENYQEFLTQYNDATMEELNKILDKLISKIENIGDNKRSSFSFKLFLL